MAESLGLLIHNFWIDLFPMFQNGYNFLYYFLDILTIIALIRGFLVLPEFILTGRSRGGRW